MHICHRDTTHHNVKPQKDKSKTRELPPSLPHNPFPIQGVSSVTAPPPSSPSPHRAGIKGELRGEVHAGRQSKRVHVQHRVVRVQQLLRHRVVSGRSLRLVARLRRRPLLLVLLMLWRAALRRRRRRRVRVRVRVARHRRKLRTAKRRGIRARPGGRVGLVVVVDHIGGLRVVLLFCTHGIKSRTDGLSGQNRKGRGGSACRVAQCDGRRRPSALLPSLCFHRSSVPSRLGQAPFGPPRAA